MAHQFRKFKAACDQCHNSKVKCTGELPLCERCIRASLPCHYSLAARAGKPMGSRNKKTLEKIDHLKRQDTIQDCAHSIDDNTHFFRSGKRVECPAGNVIGTDFPHEDLISVPKPFELQRTIPTQQGPSLPIQNTGFPDCQHLEMMHEDDLLTRDQDIAIGMPDDLITNPQYFKDSAGLELQAPWTTQSDASWTVSCERALCLYLLRVDTVIIFKSASVLLTYDERW